MEMEGGIWASWTLDTRAVDGIGGMESVILKVSRVRKISEHVSVTIGVRLTRVSEMQHPASQASSSLSI